MTLRIERITGKRRTRIRFSVKVRAEHLDQLKAEIERAGPRVALDLEEVDLVDIEGVRFLNGCLAEASQCCTVRLAAIDKQQFAYVEHMEGAAHCYSFAGYRKTDELWEQVV